MKKDWDLPPGWEVTIGMKSHKVEPTTNTFQLEVEVLAWIPGVCTGARTQRLVFTGPAGM